MGFHNGTEDVMRKNRNNGFTLVEFLCIISFACIIFPVAIPAFIGGKDKAKDVEAKANLHTIQIAIERYNTDNREYRVSIADRQGRVLRWGMRPSCGSTRQRLGIHL